MPVTLTPKQRTAAAALVEGCTGVEAARRAGCSQAAISKWRRDATFRTYMRSIGGDLVDEVRARIRSHADTAVDALADVVRDRTASATARVQAANAILARTLPDEDARELARATPSEQIREALAAIRGEAPAPRGASSSSPPAASASPPDAPDARRDDEAPPRPAPAPASGPPRLRAVPSPGHDDEAPEGRAGGAA